MIEWFLNTFSSPAEQAKLFTVAVSTSLAITLLLLNQWFTSRRARKELLVSKLEELAISVYSLYSTAYDVNQSFQLGKKYDDKNVELLVGLATKIDTISDLYFPNLKIDTGITADIISSGVDGLNDRKLENGECIPSEHPFIENSDYLHEWFQENRDSIKKEINRLLKHKTQKRT